MSAACSAQKASAVTKATKLKAEYLQTLEAAAEEENGNGDEMIEEGLDLDMPNNSTLMAKAFAQMARNDAVGHQDAAKGLLSGNGAEGSGSLSVKGAGVIMQNRARFWKLPEDRWKLLKKMIQDKLDWEEGLPWSAEKLIPFIPWGHQRFAKRMYFLVAKVHSAERREQRDVVRGLIAQSMHMIVQTVYDHGNCFRIQTVFRLVFALCIRFLCLHAVPAGSA